MQRSSQRSCRVDSASTAGNVNVTSAASEHRLMSVDRRCWSCQIMTYRVVPVTPASPQWTLRLNDTASAARLSALDATVAECQLVGFESTIYLYCDATALVTHVLKDLPAAHHDYSWHHSISISSMRILQAGTLLLSHPAPTDVLHWQYHISTQRPRWLAGVTVTTQYVII